MWFLCYQLRLWGKGNKWGGCVPFGWSNTKTKCNPLSSARFSLQRYWTMFLSAWTCQSMLIAILSSIEYAGLIFLKTLNFFCDCTEDESVSVDPRTIHPDFIYDRNKVWIWICLIKRMTFDVNILRLHLVCIYNILFLSYRSKVERLWGFWMSTQTTIK
jgi:hypothetical protein